MRATLRAAIFGLMATTTAAGAFAQTPAPRPAPAAAPAPKPAAPTPAASPRAARKPTDAATLIQAVGDQLGMLRFVSRDDAFGSMEFDATGTSASVAGPVQFYGSLSYVDNAMRVVVTPRAEARHAPDRATLVFVVTLVASLLVPLHVAIFTGIGPDSVNCVFDFGLWSAAGYRAPGDKYATLAKVRYEAEDLVKFV